MNHLETNKKEKVWEKTMYAIMNQSTSKSDVNNFNDDSTESDHASPPSKRRCQSVNSNVCLPNPSSCVVIDLTPDEIEVNKEECKSCGRQERLLRTFNCPSLHYFCLNCIYNWTQKHVETKTSPICLVIDCDYLLKAEDLHNLPLTVKDHQNLLQLIEIKINKTATTITTTTNHRLKCDKCDLYIDQHNFFSHHNECQGRSVTIPCEICYCPVLINDYEEHMLICTNEDNTTLSQFLCKHLQNPNIDKKNIKLFICSWQRKHRRDIDVYEMIEEFNQTNVFSEQICDLCKNSYQSDEFYFINCDDNHTLCLLCYRQHVKNQMDNNQILTCHQCSYHLQDKDLSENRILTDEQILLLQNYQNKKVLESYNNLYGTEVTYDINPTVQQQQQQQPGITTNNDDTPRRKCDLCSKQQSYGNIFLLNCDCKICYDCFAIEVNRQRATTNEILICSLCRSSIKHNDLGNLRLTLEEIQAIQLYQQGKLFEFEHAVHFTKQNTNQTINNNDNEDDDFDILLLTQQQCLPKYWTLPMLTNFTRHTLDQQSTEFKFVIDRFNQSWANLRNQVPMATPPPPPPPPPPLRVSVRSAPQPSPVLVQSTNNPQQSPFQPASMQRFIPIQVPPNNTNGSGTNQPTQFNNAFAPLPYFMPGTNSMLPPPLPAPPPFLPQPNYLPNIPYGHPTITLPMANTVAPRSRHRPVNRVLGIPKIIQIERIQNQRWYKQYSAHEFEFRQKLGKQTQQWLFHGCDERSSKNIEMECFNRSYAGQHAVALGQGCYFARDSMYSHNYALPDRNGIRRMFLARVLVGNTTPGNPSMRVPPSGFDTTGDGHTIFVTYHDSQAYAEYLISYQ